MRRLLVELCYFGGDIEVMSRWVQLISWLPGHQMFGSNRWWRRLMFGREHHTTSWNTDWLIKHIQIQIWYCIIRDIPRLLMWRHGLPKALLAPSCRPPPELVILVCQCAASHRPEHRNRSGTRMGTCLWQEESVNRLRCECGMCLNLLTNSSKVRLQACILFRRTETAFSWSCLQPARRNR